MMPWFIWKGKNSIGDFGLWVTKLPKKARSEERHEEIEIPGRAGSIIMLEGEDIYSSYEDEMVVTARNSLQMDKIVDWLRGSGELTLWNDPDKARPARIVNEVGFERIGNNLMQATIPFLFQPFRVSRFPEKNDRITILSTIEDAYFFNPGDVQSFPVFRLTKTENGSGTNTISVNGHAMTFTGVTGTIVVDCDAHVITKNGEIWDGGTFTGDFWRMPLGECVVHQTGDMNIVIDPNWRWL
jgi:phage-related protein